MALLFVDHDNQEYLFDDVQAEAVKRLSQESIEREMEVWKLTIRNRILEFKLRNADQAGQQERVEADQVILDHIAYLDPDHQS